jgi:hypothetical protein
MTSIASSLAAAGLAGLAWFVVAALLFFNPIVDKLYRAQERHPAVKLLPKTGATIGKILLAIAVQTTLWVIVFRAIAPALPAAPIPQGLAFGAIVAAIKLVGRDVDRILLTTYPTRRLAIELAIGLVCAAVVGIVFAYVLRPA